MFNTVHTDIFFRTRSVHITLFHIVTLFHTHLHTNTLTNTLTYTHTYLHTNSCSPMYATNPTQDEVVQGMRSLSVIFAKSVDNPLEYMTSIFGEQGEHFLPKLVAEGNDGCPGLFLARLDPYNFEHVCAYAEIEPSVARTRCLFLPRREQLHDKAPIHSRGWRTPWQRALGKCRNVTALTAQLTASELDTLYTLIYAECDRLSAVLAKLRGK